MSHVTVFIIFSENVLLVLLFLYGSIILQGCSEWVGPRILNLADQEKIMEQLQEREDKGTYASYTHE